MRQSFIGIGSNLGQRLENLVRALASLEEKGIAITSCSGVYETEPKDLTDQPPFLNAAISVATDLPPRDLLDVCLATELAMGRTRHVRFGPRILDLDVLLMGDLISEDPRILLPHPRMHLRRFVLVPLSEIAPKVFHPRLQQTVEMLLDRLNDPCRVDWYCKMPHANPIITAD